MRPSKVNPAKFYKLKINLFFSKTMKKERIIQKLLNIKLLNINMLKTSDKYTHVWVYSMFCLQVLRFLVSE